MATGKPLSGAAKHGKYVPKGKVRRKLCQQSGKIVLYSDEFDEIIFWGLAVRLAM